ncbi:MAG: hypothetical protein NC548_34035 [Lachnospiraceae bacterium]|nr:hypothetical protein [Lachnospiraceae bacterium]
MAKGKTHVKSKQKSKQRQEYEKEYKRIRNFMRRAEKRGYEFNVDIKPPSEIKRVTAKTVKELKYLTADRLYAKSKYHEPQTGVTISGIRGREKERREAGLKGYKTRLANKQAEQAFFGSVEGNGTNNKKSKSKPPKTNKPADGGLTIYYGTVEPYIKALTEDSGPLVMSPSKGIRRKSQQAVIASDQGKRTVLQLLNELVQKVGKSKVGWIFQKYSDRLTIYLDTLLYDSDANRIANATIEVVQILKEGLGEDFTLNDLEYYTEQQELFEDFEEL